MEELLLLKKLGFTEYEARAYLALAKLGPSTVREVVLESKLPRNKAYESLERLEEKNKVLSMPLSPKKYKLADPESFKEDINELNSSFESLLKIIHNPKGPEYKELFWIIKGRKAIQDKLAVQNTRAKKEILSCNKLSNILYKNIRTMTECVKRGVKVKMICNFNKDKIESYKEWLSTGAEIRVLNEKMFGPLLPRITIFDNSYARLTIGEPEVKSDEDYITLWTESRVFAQMLRNHFLNMWRNSKPLSVYLKKYNNQKK